MTNLACSTALNASAPNPTRPEKLPVGNVTEHGAEGGSHKLEPQLIVASFYKFAALDDCDALRPKIQELCNVLVSGHRQL